MVPSTIKQKGTQPQFEPEWACLCTVFGIRVLSLGSQNYIFFTCEQTLNMRSDSVGPGGGRNSYDKPFSFEHH